jgi:hypothetical protein
VQTIAAPVARVACGEVGTQLKALIVPTLTVGTQLALVAVLALMLVQVAVKPVRTWPGLTTVGVLTPRATLMSESVANSETATDPEHAGVVPVHNGSPPPVTVAVLLPVTAVAPTEIGTVITTGLAAPDGIEQGDRFEPDEILQVPIDAPFTSTGPLIVIPAGKVSVSDIEAVVGPYVTSMKMV